MSLNQIRNEILDVIRSEGAISLERYMELALYHPEEGYYVKDVTPNRVGRNGDFITSVSVGSLLGRFLAHEIKQVWMKSGSPQSFQLIEAGAGGGDLAHDVLTALSQFSPSCFEAVEMILLEPLARLREHQVQRLRFFPRVKWYPDPARWKQQGGAAFGMFYANELLDAFPARMFELTKAGEREWGISWSEARGWYWKIMKNEAVSGCEEETANPSRFETSPRAHEWLGELFTGLQTGTIWLMDYGWVDEEYFEIPRPEGTLRGYVSHRQIDPLKGEPGEVDLTYHVRWTPIQELARSLHWNPVDLIQQGRWLTRILASNPELVGPDEVRTFQSLTHPQMFGEVFRTLVLNKP